MSKLPVIRPDASEASIQRTVLAWLSKLEPRAYFYRTNTGGARTPTGFIKFGVEGQADITGVAAGRFVGIELKTLTGAKRKAQIAYGDRVRAAGGVHYFARTLEQALTPVCELLGIDVDALLDPAA